MFDSFAGGFSIGDYQIQFGSGSGGYYGGYYPYGSYSGYQQPTVYATNNNSQLLWLVVIGLGLYLIVR